MSLHLRYNQILIRGTINFLSVTSITGLTSAAMRCDVQSGLKVTLTTSISLRVSASSFVGREGERERGGEREWGRRRHQCWPIDVNSSFDLGNDWFNKIDLNLKYLIHILTHILFRFKRESNITRNVSKMLKNLSKNKMI